ncbi:hypothetical protein SDC9_183900 [bioreactor metagenome]|uniref:Uncharacterized protein n=1 Tax=bioreactor metagenome TaxID=1076179 RepID=A0A645HBH8_9ZZZZ
MVGHQHADSISQRPCRAARELRRADRRVFRNGDGTSEQHGLVVGQDRKREAHRGGGGRVDGMGMDDGAYVTARNVDLPVELFFNRGAAFALKHGSAWRQLRQISGRERRVIHPAGRYYEPLFAADAEIASGPLHKALFQHPAGGFDDIFSYFKISHSLSSIILSSAAASAG